MDSSDASLQPSWLAYVDQQLAYQLATGIIGSEVSLTKQRGASVGINFKVIFAANTGTEKSATTKVEHLLPEVLMDALYEAVPNRAATLDSVRHRLLGGSNDSFRPGTPLLLHNAKIESHPPSSEEDRVLAGESCELFTISSGTFSIRGFANPSHASSVKQLIGEPIQILGILRYAAPYRVPGAVALNLGMRILGIWIL
ncbi:MAG TPA: hypothetical protein VNF47_09560 [Streptosporangiaceae bacterium]|nr:hypothetical protein [Streptosporangiaceae bacterium]